MLTKSEPVSHQQRVASEPPRSVSAMRTTTLPCRLNPGPPRAASSCTLVKIDICLFQRSITRECQNSNGEDEKALQHTWKQNALLQTTNSQPLRTATPTSTFFLLLSLFYLFYRNYTFWILDLGKSGLFVSRIFVSNSSYLSRFIMHARLEFTARSVVFILGHLS